MIGRELLPQLGLAKKAGLLEVGEEPVGASARAKKARLILLAGDAAENSCRRAAHFAEQGGGAVAQLGCSKSELGRALGRNSCAMVALTDAGFAAAVCAKLAAAEPEKYGEMAEKLGEKAKKVLQRQKERHRHEKKLAAGARKPGPPAKGPGRGKKAKGPKG